MIKYLTTAMLGAKLGNRSRTSIWRDIAAGTLPKPMILGGRNYWPEEEIDAIMQRSRLVDAA